MNHRLNILIRVASVFLLSIFVLLQVWGDSGFSSRYPNLFIQKRIFEQHFRRLSPKHLLHINGNLTNIGFISQIFLINLPHRDDRRTRSIGVLQTLNIDAYIVPALSIHSLDVLKHSQLVKLGSITLNEIACWASHMQIWIDISNSKSNQTWTLILEDDIDLEMETIKVLESFPKQIWKTSDMIYLGHCDNPPGKLLYTGMNGYRVHYAKHPSCTHAYAIRKQGARKLIELISKPRRAIDQEIVHLNDAGQISILSIHPPLALQNTFSPSNRSDVNPSKNTWKYSVKRVVNSFFEWARGVESIIQLNDSALARADLNKADRLRITLEQQACSFLND